MADGTAEADLEASTGGGAPAADRPRDRGKTVHGEPANAGHRVLAPDDAEVEAYLETALNAPAPTRSALAGGPPMSPGHERPGGRGQAAGRGSGAGGPT